MNRAPRAQAFVRVGLASLRVGIASLLLVSCARPQRSGLTSFSDVPRFKEYEGKTYFTVSDGERDYEVWWSYWRQPDRPKYPSNFSNVVLEEGRGYRLTFAANDNTAASADFHATILRAGEQRSLRDIPPGERSFAKLIKIEDGDRVVFDQDFCPVHHRRMSVAYAPVSYGLIVVDEVIATQSPHHGRFVLGGCLGGPKTRELALVCGHCQDRFRAFEEAWNAAEQRQPPRRTANRG